MNLFRYSVYVNKLVVLSNIPYKGFPKFIHFRFTIQIHLEQLTVTDKQVFLRFKSKQFMIFQIGFPTGKRGKRIVWIDGGNHAREWPAFHTATYIINEVWYKQYLILLRYFGLFSLVFMVNCPYQLLVPVVDRAVPIAFYKQDYDDIYSIIY